ncbi:MAG: rod shape-determining protein MreD [Candidatus Binatia bacterium]
MKLSLLFLSIGFLLVLLQTTHLHLLPLGPIVPDLALVLCVYWALNRPTVSAVLGSFFLGYSVDVFSSPLLGVHAFAMSLVFLTAYLSSRYIWIHHPLLSAAVVFFASWVKVGALVMVWTLFMATESFWAGALKYFLLEAVSAAVLAPGLFFLLRQGQNYLEEVPSTS